MPFRAGDSEQSNQCHKYFHNQITNAMVSVLDTSLSRTNGSKNQVASDDGVKKEASAASEVSDPNSTQRAFAALLVTAQCFAIMPVEGVTGKTAKALRFNWCSFRILYTAFAFVGTLISTGFGCAGVSIIGPTIQNLTIPVFYGTFALRLVLFLQLATKWPTLSLRIHLIEVAMTKSYGYPPFGALKIKLLASAFLIVALVEHLLAKLGTFRMALRCEPDAWGEAFFTHYYPYIFHVTIYTRTLAAIATLFDFLATFSWSYIDIFLMMVSISITQRFAQVNRRLEAVRDKKTPQSFWQEMRETYNGLSCLVKLVDVHVNRILFLSFGSNLYFICLQLLNSTSDTLSVDTAVYFYLSFGFLLLRTLAVSLTAAGIHEESKKPKGILFTVRAESYNVEVQRLLNQVLTDEIALSGLNFFFVTRKLLLTLAGSIVTYEIVLLQLNGNSVDLRIVTNTSMVEPCW